MRLGRVNILKIITGLLLTLMRGKLWIVSSNILPLWSRKRCGIRKTGWGKCRRVLVEQGKRIGRRMRMAFCKTEGMHTHASHHSKVYAEIVDLCRRGWRRWIVWRRKSFIIFGVKSLLFFFSFVIYIIISFFSYSKTWK